MAISICIKTFVRRSRLVLFDSLRSLLQMSVKENFFVSCLGQFLQNKVNKVNAAHDSLLVSTTFHKNAVVLTILR